MDDQSDWQLAARWPHTPHMLPPPALPAYLVPGISGPGQLSRTLTSASNADSKADDAMYALSQPATPRERKASSGGSEAAMRAAHCTGPNSICNKQAHNHTLTSVLSDNLKLASSLSQNGASPSPAPAPAIMDSSARIHAPVACTAPGSVRRAGPGKLHRWLQRVLGACFSPCVRQ